MCQGHSSNLHHLMPASIQIIRGSAPALQIGTPAVPPQTFTSHLPRGIHEVFKRKQHAGLCIDLSFKQHSAYCSFVRVRLLRSVCFVPCRGCCSSGYVQLQNCPAASNRSKCGSWTAHSAAHHPSDYSGALMYFYSKMT